MTSERNPDRKPDETGGFEVWIDAARESGTEVDTRRVRMLCGGHREARLEWSLMNDFDRVREPRSGDDAVASRAVDAILMRRSGMRRRPAMAGSGLASAVDTPAKPTPALKIERRGLTNTWLIGATLSALVVGAGLGALASRLAPQPQAASLEVEVAGAPALGAAAPLSPVIAPPEAPRPADVSPAFPTPEEIATAEPAAFVDDAPATLAPDATPAARLLARAHAALERGRTLSARRTLVRVVRTYPASPEALEARVVLGELSLRSAPRLAERAFERALEEGASGEARARALHGLADLAARRGDDAEARRLRRSVAGR